MQAWDNTSPTYRSFLAIAFSDAERPRESKKFEMPPNYSYVADVFCVFMSIYFGKRFDNEGFLERNALFALPIVNLRPTGLRRMPAYSHNPRKDLEIELNLDKLGPIAKVLDAFFEEIVGGPPVKAEVELVYAAGKFYLQALQLVEDDPEIAFLNLVSAGEILSGYFSFSDEELFDKQTQSMLKTIQEKTGDEMAAAIRKRLYQVRRKFRLTLLHLLNDPFYKGSESMHSFAALKKEDLGSRLSAAYDVRSRYLHTGERFGGWIEPNCVSLEDVIIGKPVVEPAEWRKILSLTPTFIGLERIVRYCLLRFIHLHISPLDERLN